MLERLFTYGSLMPGGQYAHLLAAAGDNWQPATVTGFIDANGWGHSVGFPALVLDASGAPIAGMVLTSATLHSLWPQLDAFEGVAYERIATEVTLGTGERVAAYIYSLHHSLHCDSVARN